MSFATLVREALAPQAPAIVAAPPPPIAPAAAPAIAPRYAPGSLSADSSGAAVNPRTGKRELLYITYELNELGGEVGETGWYFMGDGALPSSAQAAGPLTYHTDNSSTFDHFVERFVLGGLAVIGGAAAIELAAPVAAAPAAPAMVTPAPVITAAIPETVITPTVASSTVAAAGADAVGAGLAAGAPIAAAAPVMPAALAESQATLAGWGLSETAPGVFVATEGVTLAQVSGAAKTVASAIGTVGQAKSLLDRLAPKAPAIKTAASVNQVDAPSTSGGTVAAGLMVATLGAGALLVLYVVFSGKGL